MSTSGGETPPHVPDPEDHSRPIQDESQAREDVTPWGWSSEYLWRLSVVISLVIAAMDTLLGHRVILIGLLIAGPCCALFSARWIRRHRPA
jgi:hypothetical protein